MTLRLESRSDTTHVFVHDGERWKEQAKLAASNAARGGGFGFSVAISGNVAIVGSPYDDDAGYRSGSAYIKYYNRCSP